MVFLVYLFVERFFPNTFYLYKKLIILPFPLEIYFKDWSSRTLAALAELSSQHPCQLLSTFYNSSFSESDTQFCPLWAASHVRAHTYLPHTCIHTHKYCFKLLLIHMWLFFIKYHKFPQSVTVIFKKQRVVRKERVLHEAMVTRRPWGAAAQGHVWVCGPATAGVCVDVCGLCYHRAGGPGKFEPCTLNSALGELALPYTGELALKTLAQEEQAVH